jgi:hypothetical protein
MNLASVDGAGCCCDGGGAGTGVFGIVKGPCGAFAIGESGIVIGPSVVVDDVTATTATSPSDAPESRVASWVAGAGENLVSSLDLRIARDGYRSIRVMLFGI